MSLGTVYFDSGKLVIVYKRNGFFVYSVRFPLKSLLKYNSGQNTNFKDRFFRIFRKEDVDARTIRFWSS